MMYQLKDTRVFDIRFILKRKRDTAEKERWLKSG